ncbi:unnamed protein product [Adineta steineri]|uniref:Uncharacterized protein n=1 Tax=Adineta steineri TaxID=433720 RepID=A0A819PQU3_9BILA|nr:unnamed protein product [Adineta steineri]CAF4011781.1 unnamed protein product [Adineta steineri]
MSASLENCKQHIFASFLRAIDSAEQPDNNYVPTKDDLYNNVKNLLNAIFPPKKGGQVVRHGLKTSLDYIVSVLSFEFTKAGTLHKGRLSTRAVEKVLSCKVYQSGCAVVADNTEITDPDALSAISNSLSTFPLYYDSFNDLLLNTRYDRKVRIKFDSNTKRYLKEEDSTVIDYVMAEPIERWWNLYCTGDKTHIEECRSWLWRLLAATLLLIWYRIHLKIDDQLWSYWYRILITAAACCVVLDAYHRKYDFVSGVKHILSKDYEFNGSTILINVRNLENETFEQDEIIERKNIEQAICSYHEIDENKEQGLRQVIEPAVADIYQYSVELAEQDFTQALDRVLCLHHEIDKTKEQDLEDVAQALESLSLFDADTTSMPVAQGK